ncbi:MAG TPA: lipase maturation factor family protein [Thermoanaerobaculia bacterium]|nr:lipase maturation factor family protein [Thermoanaerobaculia bacterium]
MARVAAPPERPLLIFDGDCGFCRMWIARWRSVTGPRVDYAPSQEVAGRFPEIPAEAFRRSVQLVLPDGAVLQGARAVFAALSVAGRTGALRAYERVPGFAPLSEAGYALVARNRGAASAVTRLLWGRSVARPEFAVSAALFLRLLGVIFLIAFVSLWTQIDGLAGSRGILPIAELLSAIPPRIGAIRFWFLPTFCWLSAGDTSLHLQCAAGVVVSALLAFGILPALCAAAATALYLSLSVAGQAFLSFQWDFLLVEAGFLAIFLSPLSLRLRFGPAGPSRTALFLVRWLLFRLSLGSGVVKLASGDPTWRALTALDFHYQTQPLPPWTAWFAHWTPHWSHAASVVILFAIELVVPFFVFGPRRLRHAAFLLLVLLQAAIAVTGNYAFFNLLTMLLCVPLLEDDAFERWRRSRKNPVPASGARRWPRPIMGAVAALIVLCGTLELSASFGEVRWPAPFLAIARAVSPLRIVNGYGLFAVMTTRRPEILVEGSADGVTWKPYEFRWKPGDVFRRPSFVAPHQPRLDWQMWFAALGSFEQDPWFARFLEKLLEGSPPVVALLGRNPFPGTPPRFVRARLWDYRFSDPAERRRTGAWWTRREIGPYGPELERP